MSKNHRELTPEDVRAVLGRSWARLAELTLTPPKDIWGLETALFLAVMNQSPTGIFEWTAWERWETQFYHADSPPARQELADRLRQFLAGDAIGRGHPQVIDKACRPECVAEMCEKRASYGTRTAHHFFGNYFKKSWINTVLIAAAADVFADRPQGQNAAYLKRRKQERAELVACDLSEVPPSPSPPVRNPPTPKPNGGQPNWDNIILMTVMEALAALPPSGPSTEALKSACQAFCDVFAPDCDLGYYSDRWLNRTEYLYQRGLNFPEATHGFLWRQDDLPTRILLTARPQLVYPPFETPSGALLAGAAGPFGDLAAEGRFQFREEIHTRRVLAVRLQWGRSAVVLFLNWRREGAAAPATATPKPDTAVTGWLREVWERVDRIDPKQLRGALEAELRPLRAAVIYFCGWLTASGLKVEERKDSLLKYSPSNLCHQICLAAEERERDASGWALANAINRALQLEQKSCRVHWIEEARTGGGEMVKVLAFDKKDDFDLQANDPADGRFPLVLDNGKLPRRSTCATAAAWKTGLVLDLSRDPWRRLSVFRKGAAHHHEIALPVVDADGRPLAVANVVSPSPLKWEHMRGTELVTHLFQKLRAIYDRPTAVGGLKAAIKELLQDDSRPKSSLEVCKWFCELVRERLKADLVRLLIFNPRVEAFLPHGVRLSQDSAVEFLKAEPNHPGLHADVNLAAEYNIIEKRNGIHALLEYLIAWRLLPRPSGNTWRIFADGEPFPVPDTSGPTPGFNLDAIARKYFKTILGLPFRHDRRAQPDGVLWISWRTSQAETCEAVAGAFLSPPKTDSALGRLVAQLAEVVAAVMTVHRCFNPKVAAEPLPMWLSQGLPERTEAT